MRKAREVKYRYDMTCEDCNEPFETVQRKYSGDQGFMYMTITDTYECKKGHSFEVKEEVLI